MTQPIAETSPVSENNALPAERGGANTPAMRQYQEFKKQYPDYVLFFRMGDFYEMFWEDAELAARVLGVTLTSRSRGGLGAADAIPMAGVPFHAVEGYLRRMIASGHRVAICEQMEDPALAKGVIKREVVRLMTPGTLTDESLLDGRCENFIVALATGISKAGGYRAALAWVELSTGACVAASGSEGQILDEIARLRPAEVLVPEQPSGRPHQICEKLQPLGITSITTRPGWHFTVHQRASSFRSNGKRGRRRDSAFPMTIRRSSRWARCWLISQKRRRPRSLTCARCAGMWSKIT